MDTSGSLSPSTYRVRIWYVALLLLVFSCAVLGITREWNDLRLHSFATTLFRSPLPPQTEILSQTTHFGALVGLHNHCDYVAEQVVMTRLSEAEIKQFYSTTTIPSVDGSSKHVPIEVIIDQEHLADGRLRLTIKAADYDQPKGLELRCS